MLLIMSITWSARHRPSVDLLCRIAVVSMTVCLSVHLPVDMSVGMSTCLAFGLLGIGFLVLLLLLARPEMHDLQVWLIAEPQQMTHAPHCPGYGMSDLVVDETPGFDLEDVVKFFERHVAHRTFALLGRRSIGFRNQEEE